MRIPMVDLATQYRELKPQLEPALLAALEATQFILGPNVQAFEAEAAAYLGVKHAISCANGTDALHLALRALGPPPVTGPVWDDGFMAPPPHLPFGDPATQPGGRGFAQPLRRLLGVSPAPGEKGIAQKSAA